MYTPVKGGACARLLACTVAPFAFAIAATLLFATGRARSQATKTKSPLFTIRSRTFLTVRLNKTISSDRNHAGDMFSAVLAQPLVVNGIAVAQRDQNVVGRHDWRKRLNHLEQPHARFRCGPQSRLC